VTPLGIDPETSRLVAQCLNHYATPGPAELRVVGQLSEEVRVAFGVPRESVLGPLHFLAYVNDIWRNTESTVRLLAHNRIICRKFVNKKDIETLQKDLDRLGDWAVEKLIVVKQGSLFYESPSKETTKLFVRELLKNGNSNIKSIAYTSLTRPILEYGAACWEGQINVLDRVQI
jgi:hypothetical protein